MKVSEACPTNQQPLSGRPFAIAVAGFLLTVMLHTGAVAQTKPSQGIRNIMPLLSYQKAVAGLIEQAAANAESRVPPPQQ